MIRNISKLSRNVEISRNYSKCQWKFFIVVFKFAKSKSKNCDHEWINAKFHKSPKKNRHSNFVCKKPNVSGKKIRQITTFFRENVKYFVKSHVFSWNQNKNWEKERGSSAKIKQARAKLLIFQLTKINKQNENRNVFTNF